MKAVLAFLGIMRLVKNVVSLPLLGKTSKIEGEDQSRDVLNGRFDGPIYRKTGSINEKRDTSEHQCPELRSCC